MADVERLSRGSAPIAKSAIEDPVVLLRRQWKNVMAERDQLKNRDGDNPKHPDVLEDERLHDVQLDIEDSIADTPTHTAVGIAVKLRQLQRDDEVFDGMSSWRPAAFRMALEALGRNTATIVLDMDPLVCALCNGTAVAVASSDQYANVEQNGISFIADALDTNAVQLKELWKELDLATR
jgi:hypothetical protein